jgi:D-alanine--poly(phosphoribitol) ligase subunit 2
MPLHEEVVAAIEAVTQEPEVRANQELPLFELQVLDSLRTIMLMVELNSRFGVDIAPSEIDREAWATPALITRFVEERVQR